MKIVVKGGLGAHGIMVFDQIYLRISVKSIFWHCNLGIRIPLGTRDWVLKCAIFRKMWKIQCIFKDGIPVF